jgi:hypothetical protein
MQTVLAQAIRTERAVWDLLLTYSWLVLAILLLAAVIAATARWYRRTRDRGPIADSLLDFRELYQRGELSDQEYERIKAKLRERRASPAPSETNPSSTEPPAES